jgi:hypothetical protein
MLTLLNFKGYVDWNVVESQFRDEFEVKFGIEQMLEYDVMT